MNARFAFALLVGCLSLPLSASPFAATLNSNMQKVDVDMATNAETPLAANPFQSRSLAVDPTGKLISINAGGVLFDVTGGPIPLGATGMTTCGDLDWGVGGLWGYDNSTDQLFFFDTSLSSVTSSFLMSGIGAGQTVDGVAYRPSDGSIFLSAHNPAFTDFLYHVPAFSSTALPVGLIVHGDANSYVADIDFDSGGTLYAMTWYHRDFYTVSQTTAATNLVSTGPHRDVTAMAIRSVPEPTTWSALAIGLLALRRKASRRT